MLSPRLGMVYLAALVGADGHLETRRPYIVISSKEKDFLQDRVIPLILAQIGRRVKPYWDKSAGIWKIRIYSRDLWHRLQQNFDVPTGVKAASIKPPKNLDPEERIWYLRSWLDGEGWVEVMTVKRGYGTYQYPRIGFKVKNQHIRDWILDELLTLKMRVKGYNRKDGTYGLWINGNDACQAFLNSVSFYYQPRNQQLKDSISKYQGKKT